MDRVWVSFVGLTLAVCATAAYGAFDPSFTYGSDAEDESDSGLVGDLLLVAEVDYRGSSAEGRVAVLTKTSQAGTDTGVPSNESGVKLAQSDAWLRWADSNGTGTHDFTYGYGYYALGSGTSHATPVSQTLYLGSYQHEVTDMYITRSGGVPVLGGGFKYEKDLEDNDSFNAAEGTSYSATTQASADANGVWADFDIDLQALTSYAGYNQPPVETGPSHGATATLEVSWVFSLEFD